MKIGNPTQKAPLSALWQEAFGDSPAFFDLFYENAFSAERCRCLWMGEELAAALYWFDCRFQGKKIAYIYGVATARKFQRQGLCSRLMEDTHSQLKKNGYAAAILVPVSEGLFNFYAKLGYAPCSNVEEFSALPGEESLELRVVKAEEYAALRREFLPQGGVIQEEENLRFLAAQFTLYAGQGFLLAGHQSKDNFWGAELLGDPARAPGILKTLGAPRGKFRIPGNTRPFTMLLPFEPLTPPAYFGWAFD